MFDYLNIKDQWQVSALSSHLLKQMLISPALKQKCLLEGAAELGCPVEFFAGNSKGCLAG